MANSETYFAKIHRHDPHNRQDHNMLTDKFRSDFYPTRFTDHDLKYQAALSSQCIYQCETDGHSSHFWQFVFNVTVEELRRRTDAAEGQYREPLPVEFPSWRGAELGTALMTANGFTYLNQSPAVAHFADWLAWSLTLLASNLLTHYADERSHAQSI